MNTLLILFIFIPVLSLVLLLLNVLLSPNRPDSEKVYTYECGFSPILGQTRNTFHISFFPSFLVRKVYPLISCFR